MRNIHEIEVELHHLKVREAGIRQSREALERELRDLNSRDFIRVNRVTSDDVQKDCGEGVPWHGNAYGFGEWLKETGCRKRFAVWNGWLHYTSDLVAGIFQPTDGLAEHVPAGKNV